ncbi:hypothetical protein TNCV_2066961 [Trichonephila clavipes]|uniref:Uncharacterized protein n=1 Tax=Trichonephila clavipes TaxID=2585209 RepID=A0A8X7BCX3_TRICX|nr:hypothetical protein TNCV_2066961 [Trichonephila clavipes]
MHRIHNLSPDTFLFVVESVLHFQLVAEQEGLKVNKSHAFITRKNSINNGRRSFATSIRHRSSNNNNNSLLLVGGKQERIILIPADVCFPREMTKQVQDPDAILRRMSVIYPTLKIGYLSSMGSKRYPLTFRRGDGWPFIVDRYFEMITFSPAVFLDARELKSRDPEIVGGALCEELKQKKIT